jgi:hypothetical protein
MVHSGSEEVTEEGLVLFKIVFWYFIGRTFEKWEKASIMAETSTSYIWMEIGRVWAVLWCFLNRVFVFHESVDPTGALVMSLYLVLISIREGSKRSSPLSVFLLVWWLLMAGKVAPYFFYIHVTFNAMFWIMLLPFSSEGFVLHDLKIEVYKTMFNCVWLLWL